MKKVFLIISLSIMVLLLFACKKKNGWYGDYYYDNNCKVKNEWRQYGEDWYYCGPNGEVLKSSWINDEYYVDENGKMLKNTFTPDGYFVGVDGKYIDQNKLANEMLFAQIKNAKCVIEYDTNTIVDMMDTVTFGVYPQSDITGTKKDPIEWLILEKKENKALLLSKYILDYKSYHNTREDMTWEKCDLRKWLNNDFINIAFSKENKDIIVKGYLPNIDNEEYGTYGGNDTNDKVFCLSYPKCYSYFKITRQMRDIRRSAATRGTPYEQKIEDESNYIRVGKLGEISDWNYGNSPYWLSSPGKKQNQAFQVSIYGHLVADAPSNVVDAMCGVRPALWVSYSGK